MHRRSRALMPLALATASVALVSGCSFTSPIEAGKPYAASDGINLDVPDAQGAVIHARNMLAVGGVNGGPASVVGRVYNSSDHAVALTLTVTPAPASTATPSSAVNPDTPGLVTLASTSFVVPAHSTIALGANPGGVTPAASSSPSATATAAPTVPNNGTLAFIVPRIPSGTGSTVTIRLAAGAGGVNGNLPVVDAVGPYASLAPATTEPEPSVTGGKSDSAKPKPSGSGSTSPNTNNNSGSTAPSTQA